eukprot:scaffold6591_cov328-Ochromonas_danica.AAC.10
MLGPNPAKQFRNAILERDEEKAISLYTAAEGENNLLRELHPSRPFPSKKETMADSPLFLACKCALQKLVMMLLEMGGDPSTLNSQQETCLHAVCSLGDYPEMRCQILDQIYSWIGVTEDGKEMEKVSVNKVDDNGNTAIHLAAANGLLACVERLIALGAIISIVNKNNLTCCELADEGQHKDLALMLELALVFQIEDEDLRYFDRFADTSFVPQPARLLVDCFSLTAEGLLAGAEECTTIVAQHIGWMSSSAYRARAEALLNSYAWDVDRLLKEYMTDAEKVLSARKMASPAAVLPSSPPPKLSNLISKPAAEELEINMDEVAIDVDGTVAPSQGENCDVVSTGDDCVICGEKMTPFFPLEEHLRGVVSDPDHSALTCLSGHTFCLSCWGANLSAQMSEHTVGNIPCPAFKCGDCLDLAWAPILMKDDAQVLRLKTARVRQIVDCAGLKYCPVDNCGLIVHIPKDANSAVNSAPTTPLSPDSVSSLVQHSLPRAASCSNGHVFCLQCNEVAHTPCSCSDYLRWAQLVAQEIKTTQIQEASNSDEIANALWVAANTKRCPRCGTAIEKDEGCNHMSCRKCRKEFCWICMQDWALHSDSTGGYFQCNRFMENNNSNDNNNNNSDISELVESQTLWAEERGNAHAEAMRSRERSRKMARFIHHFTRHKAHADSMAMERKMHKETLKRIGDGLLACQHGQLKWLQGDIVANPLDHMMTTSLSPSNGGGNGGSGGDSGLLSTPLKDNVSKGEEENRMKKHAVTNCECCIEFLNEGFGELLLSRSFLQWSYPYSYFEFMDNDDLDYSHDRRSRWVRINCLLTANLLGGWQSNAHHVIPSDVCARRRLRASQAQIQQASRAARQKRVELEALLIAYSTMKEQMQRSERDSGRRASTGSMGSGNRSRSVNSNTLSRRMAPQSTLRTINRNISGSRRSPPWRRPLTTTLEDLQANGDGLDLATLLLELEMASNQENQNGRPPRPGTPGAPEGQSPEHPPSTQRPRPRPQSAREEPYRSPQSDGRRAQSVGLRMSTPRRTSHDQEDDSHPEGRDTPRPRSHSGGDDLSPVGSSADENDDSSQDSVDDIDMLTMRHHSNTPQRQLRERDLMRLARRAEEAAALNRAILMSLQDPPSRADDRGNVPPPSAQHVDALVSMGFTVQQAEQALRESGDNVDLAASRLLGL